MSQELKIPKYDSDNRLVLKSTSTDEGTKAGVKIGTSSGTNNITVDFLHTNDTLPKNTIKLNGPNLQVKVTSTVDNTNKIVDFDNNFYHNNTQKLDNTIGIKKQSIFGGSNLILNIDTTDHMSLGSDIYAKMNTTTKNFINPFFNKINTLNTSSLDPASESLLFSENTSNQFSYSIKFDPAVRTPYDSSGYSLSNAYFTLTSNDEYIKTYLQTVSQLSLPQIIDLVVNHNCVLDINEEASIKFVANVSGESQHFYSTSIYISVNPYEIMLGGTADSTEGTTGLDFCLEYVGTGSDEFSLYNNAGEINLHKISKTGSYGDLNERPYMFTAKFELNYVKSDTESYKAILTINGLSSTYIADSLAGLKSVFINNPKHDYLASGLLIKSVSSNVESYTIYKVHPYIPSSTSENVYIYIYGVKAGSTTLDSLTTPLIIISSTTIKNIDITCSTI